MGNIEESTVAPGYVRTESTKGRAFTSMAKASGTGLGVMPRKRVLGERDKGREDTPEQSLNDRQDRSPLQGTPDFFHSSAWNTAAS